MPPGSYLIFYILSFLLKIIFNLILTRIVENIKNSREVRTPKTPDRMPVCPRCRRVVPFVTTVHFCRGDIRAIFPPVAPDYVNPDGDVPQMREEF